MVINMTTSNMSIQDIEATFRLLRRHNPYGLEGEETISLSISAFSDVLEHRNPVFDRALFYKNTLGDTP